MNCPGVYLSEAYWLTFSLFLFSFKLQGEQFVVLVGWKALTKMVYTDKVGTFIRKVLQSNKTFRMETQVFTYTINNGFGKIKR